MVEWLIIQWVSKFLVARKEVHKKCRIGEQCTGTENANTCFTNGKEENEEGACECNDQFGWIDGECLKSMIMR